ncbi:HesB/YadR/YfhF family protein [Sediminibacillus albus]|uniref:Uncharacterized protein YneR n=1 Tax=Sediminibacillus albus TaxID=407036 RepID=A0A1G8VWK3_9BACI|nr:HesB/YadR/YfhF family protein [Sediminibacillus albus]SDJ70197.1 Uncharacterized protein YneR [Sediminibacillus albus]
MNLQISEEAAEWYKNELELEETDEVRFFVRYGGIGGHQPGFSLGIAAEAPSEPVTESEVHGILFFVEQQDSWYFDGADLHIEYNGETEEPSFEYN